MNRIAESGVAYATKEKPAAGVWLAAEPRIQIVTNEEFNKILGLMVRVCVLIARGLFHLLMCLV